MAGGDRPIAGAPGRWLRRRGRIYIPLERFRKPAPTWEEDAPDGPHWAYVHRDIADGYREALVKLAASQPFSYGGPGRFEDAFDEAEKALAKGDES